MKTDPDNNSGQRRLLLCMPHMGGEEIRFIKDAIAGNWAVPMGPHVDAFERELAAFLGVADERVVALASGTAALHLALIACGIGPGDEVLCQSMTFCASCNPVRYVGATPVFIDSEPLTWNMDPDLLEHAIIERTAATGSKPKAIIVVHLYGMPAQIDRIQAISRKYAIPLIEDAAEAFGSCFNGRAAATFGDFGVLSFNGNKMITTSGGGALIVPDEATRRRILFYATQAREGYPYYQHEEIGYNYRLSNISACIGLGQMRVLNDHLARHREVHARYVEFLAGDPRLIIHSNPGPQWNANFWLTTALLAPDVRVKGHEQAYAQTVDSAIGGAAGVTRAAASPHTGCEPDPDVEALRMHLADRSIESRPLWKPMHRQPVYSSAPALTNGVSETLFARGICLPSGPDITPADQRRIITALREVI